MAWGWQGAPRMDCGNHGLSSAQSVAPRGDASATAHLYSNHYRELVSVDRAAGTVTPVDHK